MAVDASARRSMKDAAKSDKHCEWQNSERKWNAERILHSQVAPVSISALRVLMFCEVSYAFSMVYLACVYECRCGVYSSATH